jgi:endonuclease/exonuclease/phosphatase family metal-dependent hydrolase
MSTTPFLRVMTYNVHRCIGTDGKLSPRRIARVISQYAPDVVALQELDIGHARSGFHDQPAVLAELLKMRYFFHPAIAGANEHYGDAILSRYPMRLIHTGPLPRGPVSPRVEPRGALWTEIEWQGRTLNVFNTHLGLRRRERLAQVEALLSTQWLAHPDCRSPRLLCGDFNAWPGAGAYQRLRQVLHDASQRCGLTGPRGTFPSLWPFLRIDHVFHDAGVTVQRAFIPRTTATRRASDHLPFLVEVSWS